MTTLPGLAGSCSPRRPTAPPSPSLSRAIHSRRLDCINRWRFTAGVSVGVPAPDQAAVVGLDDSGRRTWPMIPTYADSARLVMERCDVLGAISEEPDRLTRRYGTEEMRQANAA